FLPSPSCCARSLRIDYTRVATTSRGGLGWGRIPARNVLLSSGGPSSAPRAFRATPSAYRDHLAKLLTSRFPLILQLVKEYASTTRGEHAHQITPRARFLVGFLEKVEIVVPAEFIPFFRHLAADPIAVSA